MRGVRVDAPVRRRAGAGPSDDGHVWLGGRGAALPIAPTQPVRGARRPAAAARAPTSGSTWSRSRRPRFYDLTTADGVPYESLARLHGTDVLATTVVQTCVRYREPDRCRFCAIEQSLAAGATTRLKTPAQLAEVAAAAVRLDGVRQMVMTTGSTAGPDRGAKLARRGVRAVVAAVPGLPVQVQCEPPADLAVIAELRDAGATAIGIHVESLDDDVRRRWTPGKATVPLSAYEAAWARGGARVRPQPGLDLPADRPGRGPGRAGGGRRAADRDGRLPVRRAVPSAGRHARRARRRRRAGPGGAWPT